ncbi:hypothetical protein ACPB9E_35695 [Streptomyces exfoliatus]|uniref:hypothetical protein n=1 Tax=Streptomyces exfoliatus TaxID=1905 RepID=UPI003C2C44BC
MPATGRPAGPARPQPRRPAGPPDGRAPGRPVPALQQRQRCGTSGQLDRSSRLLSSPVRPASSPARPSRARLNSNHTADNLYACTALIRAVLDHISPAFGHKDFKQVAAQYPFKQTDKGHAKNLISYKVIGDDTLHRQIAATVPPITMHDVPPPALLSGVLHELAAVLRKPGS